MVGQLSEAEKDSGEEARRGGRRRSGALARLRPRVRRRNGKKLGEAKKLGRRRRARSRAQAVGGEGRAANEEETRCARDRRGAHAVEVGKSTQQARPGGGAQEGRGGEGRRGAARARRRGQRPQELQKNRGLALAAQSKQAEAEALRSSATLSDELAGLKAEVEELTVSYDLEVERLQGGWAAADGQDKLELSLSEKRKEHEKALLDLDTLEEQKGTGLTEQNESAMFNLKESQTMLRDAKAALKKEQKAKADAEEIARETKTELEELLKESKAKEAELQAKLTEEGTSRALDARSRPSGAVEEASRRCDAARRCEGDAEGARRRRPSTRRSTARSSTCASRSPSSCRSSPEASASSAACGRRRRATTRATP